MPKQEYFAIKTRDGGTRIVKKRLSKNRSKYLHGRKQELSMFVHKETGDKVYLYTGGLNFAGVPEAVVTFSDKFGLDEADTVLPSHEFFARSEEHTSELQSQFHLVCRLL